MNVFGRLDHLTLPASARAGGHSLGEQARPSCGFARECAPARQQTGEQGAAARGAMGMARRTRLSVLRKRS